MLRHHAADACRAMRDPGADGDRRSGYGCADLTRTWAAADKGKGHLFLMSRSVDVSIPRPTASLDSGRQLPAAGLMQLAASVILLSSAWPLTKFALSLGSTPIWFAEGRAVLSGGTAAILLAVLGRLSLPRRADVPAMVAIGVGQLGLYFALAHEALVWVPAGRTAILANTTTIWVVPLSLIFLPERIPLRRWLAAGLGILGVAVLMNPWAIDWTSPDVLIGHAFLLGAALSWSAAIIVTRATRPHMSMFQLLPWCFAIASIMLVPVIIWHAPNGGIGRHPGSWAALAYIGLIAGPLGTWCVMQATATLPTIVSSVGFLTTPAVSLILADLFLDEPITIDLLAGSALIMFGVGIAAWPRRRT
jgi:drug/metabolite transporter (DMT)-like permease